MAPPFKHVVMIGATSGIGLDMADRLVAEGGRVIAIGRRQERLDDFVRRHGVTKATGIAFDISRVDEIPQFVSDVTSKYPDIDCVFLNAGTQNRFNVADSAEFDLAKFQHEVTVNFTSMVALTHAFLPFLIQRAALSNLIFTGSNLAIVPAATLPAYSASKAALNAFVLCLREQLRNSAVKVIEISPPPVQTELHDYMGEDVGRSLGMPLAEYTDVTYKRLAAGEDQIVVGSVGPADTFNEIIDKRRTAFSNLAKLMRGET